MRLDLLRVLCVLLVGVCCLRSLPGQESRPVLKPRIQARHIKENVAQVYQTVPALQAPEQRAKLTERKAGEAHLVPVRLPAMTPARFEGDQRRIKLPAEFSDVVEGGGGRFLIFYLKELKQLAIFDVSAARVVKYLPLDSEDVTFAASADKLVIVARDKNEIQRYDLFTFEKELTKPLQGPDLYYKLAMGSASNGPLLLCSGGGSDFQRQFLDLATLEPNGMVVKSDRWDARGGPTLIVRASANGRLFTLTDGNTAMSLVVRRKTAEQFRKSRTGGFCLPSSNGKTIYHNGDLYSYHLKPLTSSRKWIGVPSTSGDFFLAREENGQSSTLLILHPDSPDPVLSIPGIGEPMDGIYYSLIKGKERGYRLYLAQEAKVLVFLPATSSEIVLYRLDIEQALEKSDTNYFFVASQPPTSAERGKRFEYTVRVKSKPAQVKYQINLGVEGMSVTPEGQVQWQVPRDFPDGQVDVVLSITGASGKEILQTFQLEIKGEKAATVAVPDTAVTQQSGPVKTDSKYSPLPVITPAELKADQKQINLPAAMTDLVVGGGGRFLILSLPGLNRLAVVDTSKVSPVKYLPVDSGDILFAASGYHLMVLLRDKMLFQRWNLLTLERELMVPVPTTARISGMVMGSASHGPLVLFCKPGLSYLFLDPDTMQLINLEKGAGSSKKFIVDLDRRQGLLKYAHASADGQVVAVRERILALKSTSYDEILSPRSSSPGYRKHFNYGMRPSTDGQIIYAPRDVYSQQMKRGPDILRRNNLLIPATQPGYFLSLNGHYSRESSTGLSLCLEGESEPFAELKNVDVSLNRKAWTVDDRIEGMPYTKRYTFVPDANLLIQIPTENNRLILHKIKTQQLLDQSGRGYLFVASRSMSAARLGQTWQHQVEVKSKQGGVQYELKSGPEGATISPTGRLTWKVPSDFTQLQAQVVLNLRDRSGKNKSHTVTISIPEAAENVIRAAENAARAAEKEAARLKAEKEAMARLAQERQKMRFEEQRRLRTRVPVNRPQKLTTEQALKIAPIAKAKAEANARLMFERKVEEFNQKQITPNLRTWTDYKENQFDAQLTRVFAGNAFFSTPIMKQDRTNLTIKLPVDKLSDADRKLVKGLIAYRVEQRKLYETVRTENHSPRYQMTMIWPEIQTFSARSSWQFPAYSVDAEGKPLLSWRVQLLPLLGGIDLYRLFRLDEPWDSEHNRQLIRFMPDFYRSPDSKAETGKTNLLGVSGEHCLFFGVKGPRFTEVKDGLDQTALLVEVPDALAVEWTKPADWEYVDQNSIKSLFGFRSDGFYVMYANGRSELISSKNSLSDLSRLFTHDDGLPLELK